MLPGVACCGEVAGDGLRRQERGVQVEPHDVVERLGGRREHRAPTVLQTARDVHEPVERAQLGGRAVDRARDLVGLPDVGDQRDDPATDVGDGALRDLELLSPEVDRADGDAGFGEHPAHRGADPASARAGDDDGAPLQPEPFLDRAHGRSVYTSMPASRATDSPATNPSVMAGAIVPPAPGYARPITVVAELPAAYRPGMTASWASSTRPPSSVTRPAFVPRSLGYTSHRVERRRLDRPERRVGLHAGVRVVAVVRVLAPMELGVDAPPGVGVEPVDRLAQRVGGNADVAGERVEAVRAVQPARARRPLRRDLLQLLVGHESRRTDGADREARAVRLVEDPPARHGRVGLRVVRVHRLHDRGVARGLVGEPPAETVHEDAVGQALLDHHDAAVHETGWPDRRRPPRFPHERGVELGARLLADPDAVAGVAEARRAPRRRDRMLLVLLAHLLVALETARGDHHAAARLDAQVTTVVAHDRAPDPPAPRRPATRPATRPTAARAGRATTAGAGP